MQFKNIPIGLHFVSNTEQTKYCPSILTEDREVGFNKRYSLDYRLLGWLVPIDELKVVSS